MAQRTRHAWRAVRHKRQKRTRFFIAGLVRDCLSLFPNLPERTRLFRLLSCHRIWADRFLAEPTLLGVCDSFGVELIHPKREGRSDRQIGKKGLSNHRWIVGVKWCPLINSRGQIVDWDAETANVYDGDFQDRLLCDHAEGEKGMGVLVDSNFHKSEKRGGDLPNLKVCKRGENNLRMLVETLFSQVTGVFSMKKITERAWDYVEAHLGFAAAAYNLLISWGWQSYHGRGRFRATRYCTVQFIKTRIAPKVIITVCVS